MCSDLIQVPLGNQGIKTFHTMRKAVGVRYLDVVVDDNDDDDRLLTGDEEIFNFFFLFCRQIVFHFPFSYQVHRKSCLRNSFVHAIVLPFSIGLFARLGATNACAWCTGILVIGDTLDHLQPFIVYDDPCMSTSRSSIIR